MSINARSRTVLSQVVTLHYRTCNPIGSALISKTRALSCSPATIRNIMMGLENTGYLSQPHTSAGRLPTDLGYRTYVDGLRLSDVAFNLADKSSIETMIDTAPSPSSALQNLAAYIQHRTNLLTFHLPIRQSGLRLGHLHLERISDARILALWVGLGGQTFQSFLNISANEISRPLCERTANYINQAFKSSNLVTINRTLTAQFQNDPVNDAAARVISSLLQDAQDLDPLNFQGMSQLLEMPEFHTVDRVRTICGLVEEQRPIKRLINHALTTKEEGVSFFIGGEMGDPKLDSLAVILAKFRHKQDWIGCVGALGPKRLPYLHALQMFHKAQEVMTTAAY